MIKTLFKKEETKTEKLSTQDFIDVEDILEHAIELKNGYLIGGIICPPINTQMMDAEERNIVKNELAITIANQYQQQHSTKSIPVDFSQIIERENEKLESENNQHKRMLQSGYVNMLEDKAMAATNTEKEYYYVICEQINRSDVEGSYHFLMDKIETLRDDISNILEDGYDTEMMTGDKLFQCFEVDVNIYKAKTNRFITNIPSFVDIDEEDID